MRVVIQRVASAAVDIEGERIASIGRGLLVLAAFASTDTSETADWIARKIPSLRVFEDGEGKLNRSLEDAEGELLIVSQFTLYGDCRKGNRPSFDKSAPPELAEALYGSFLASLSAHTRLPVKSGVFQANMQVSLVNDGPVTLVLERE